MKKQYSGLTTERITVQCEFPLATSNVRLKAKTNDHIGNSEWEEEDVPISIGASSSTDNGTEFNP